MPTVTVTGLNVIAIHVTDLSQAEEFYRDQLGFQKCQDMPPGILMESADVTIYLEPGRQQGAERKRTAAEVSPCFACRSVKAASEALRAAGVPFVSDYQEFGPSFAFFQIMDPDGNVIEFAGEP